MYFALLHSLRADSARSAFRDARPRAARDPGLRAVHAPGSRASRIAAGPRRVRRTRLLALAAAIGLLPMAGGAPAPRETLRQKAWQEIGYNNFRGAAPFFRRLRDAAEPGSDAWIEATMGLALAYQHRQPDTKSDKDRAAALYDELIRATEGNPVQALALLMRARLADQIDYYGDQPDPETARKLYGRIIRQWPQSPYVHRAALYIAQLDVFSMTRDGAEKGVRFMREWLQQHPRNPLAYLQWELIAYASMYPLDRPADAVAAFRKAEEAGLPPFTKWDSFYWRVANLAQKAGDRATAAAYFRRIITDVQRSGFAYEAAERLRELGETPPPLVDPFAEPAESASEHTTTVPPRKGAKPEP